MSLKTRFGVLLPVGPRHATTVTGLEPVWDFVDDAARKRAQAPGYLIDPEKGLKIIQLRLIDGQQK